MFDPENYDELEAGVRELLENKDSRKKLKQKGLAQVAKFSWQRCAEETIEFFQQINKEETC